MSAVRPLPAATAPIRVLSLHCVVPSHPSQLEPARPQGPERLFREFAAGTGLARRAVGSDQRKHVK